MEFMSEIPENGIGIGMNAVTKQAFMAINGEIFPLNDEQLDSLLLALMYIVQVQEMDKTAGFN